MIDFIKNIIGKVLAFTTGLGFYGLGLFVLGILGHIIGWPNIGSGLIGAFIFKNYAAIIAYLRKEVESI